MTVADDCAELAVLAGRLGPAYRVLVTGSRDWDNERLICESLTKLLLGAGAGGAERFIVVHGDARGADRIASNWVRYHRPQGIAPGTAVSEERHPAEWDRFGKRAGLIRNQVMVEGGAEMCLAFIRNGSPGATHCAGLAEKAGIPTRRFTA